MPDGRIPQNSRILDKKRAAFERGSIKFNREASNGYGGSHPKTRANRITHPYPKAAGANKRLTRVNADLPCLILMGAKMGQPTPNYPCP